MDCQVPGCDTQPEGHRSYCPKHYRRLQTYGYLEPPDPPIPQMVVPGVSDERLAELKALTWDELVAHCDAVLHEFHHPNEPGD